MWESSTATNKKPLLCTALISEKPSKARAQAMQGNLLKQQKREVGDRQLMILRAEIS